MLKCNKCKFPIDDMTDGCSLCRDFKRKHLHRDSEGENSIIGDIHDLRRQVRSTMEHLSYVHTRKYAKQTEEYDPELVKAQAQAARTLAEILKMIQKVNNDAKRQLLNLSSEGRNLLLAKAIASAPQRDREHIIKLLENPDLQNMPIVKTWTSNMVAKKDYD